MMKVITFAAVKGGVGKTTMCFNLAEWLIANNKKVLIIDSDHQGSLTHLYRAAESKDNLYDLFNYGRAKIKQVRKNLSIIPSSPNLDKLEASLAVKSNQNFLMMMWLQDHIDQVKDYDYILIDCHPDFMTVTKNMIAISHYVISLLEPSEFGFMNLATFESRMELFKKEAIDVRTRESYIDAKTIYIPNKIKHNTSSSRELLQSLKKDKSGMVDLSLVIPQREVFNQSTLTSKSVFDILKDKRDIKSQQLREQLIKIFENIVKKVSE
ncbi:hypothetical protein B2D45_01650 [Lactobacillus hilgardii]